MGAVCVVAASRLTDGLISHAICEERPRMTYAQQDMAPSYKVGQRFPRMAKAGVPTTSKRHSSPASGIVSIGGDGETNFGADESSAFGGYGQI